MVVSPNSNKNQNIQAESVNNEDLTLFFFYEEGFLKDLEEGLKKSSINR